MAPASPATRKLAATVNGPLFEQLAVEVQFEECACVEMFRHGASQLRFIDIHVRMFHALRGRPI